MRRKYSDHIFVYGTLRRKCGNRYKTLFERYACHIDDGYCFGKLFEVANYPGAILLNQNRSRIIGEIYQLSNPDKVFTKLDDYEECSSKYPEPHEFRRSQTTVVCSNGTSLTAWIYLYNLSVKNLQPIVSGDYLDYITAIDS